VCRETIWTRLPDSSEYTQRIDEVGSVAEALQAFMQQYEVDSLPGYPSLNGLFGHFGFESVQYFDSLAFDPEKRRTDIPEVNFFLYRFVVAINHFKNELYILENRLPGQEAQAHRLEALIRSQKIPRYAFYLEGQETSNLTDQGFMELVSRGKEHCQRGDVFQIVFSRAFRQSFRGDEFNVYRVLRSINPSPYLFYFDFGSYKIFGSSPEIQMAIRGGVAQVNPIAGTYRRTGHNEADAQKARELAQDPKENAEHIMLVDLARNDLGRHASHVRVSRLKEIQYFSHVIHLTSTVKGDLHPGINPIQVFGDTFPAGTLSGAPKYKALQLIGQYENQHRSFYGGALGFIGFDGEINQAIVIRSFLSKDNVLHYQAGAGVVIDSQEEKELREVNNKLSALTKALVEAEKI
jgi:anthranilate synthase component 1